MKYLRTTTDIIITLEFTLEEVEELENILGSISEKLCLEKGIDEHMSKKLYKEFKRVLVSEKQT